jgi:hypothetical protein
MTGEVELVEKNGYKGVRFYLQSGPSLHHTALDDDRSAVTFWIPHTKSEMIALESALGRGEYLVNQYVAEQVKT